jgi:hypothetical protein
LLKLKFKLRTSGDMCSIIKMITTWDTHCCTYVFVHSVCAFFFLSLCDENSHQLIHSRLRVWSALMLVGFMSNERFVHVWMNEWMNRMEIYVYVYIKARRGEEKKVYLCRKVRYLMLYSDYVLRWIMVSYAWWTFFLSPSLLTLFSKRT